MKKIYTILAGSLMSLLSFAGNGFNDGKLSVTYAGTEDIRISVDGKDYSNRDNTVMIDNLQPGYHTVKVYQSIRRGGFFGGRRDRDNVLYTNSVYVKPRTFVDVMINRFGRAFVDEQRLDNNGGWSYDENDNHGQGNGNGGYGNGNGNGGYGNGNGNGNGGYGNGNNGGWNNGNVIRDRDFADAKEQIKKEWFENSRVSIAKQVIDGYNFTTSQVKEIMNLFTFEDNKLEIAKYAYSKTVDRQNYYQLNDALTFQSSKDELARFIRNGGR